VRCRPMNAREKEMKCTKCVSVESDVCRISIRKDDEPADLAKAFTYDAVFDEGSRQEEVYQETALPLVESVLAGYNGTIFAYGQTGCGKSYSMMGVPTDPDLMGIIPRAFRQIFAEMANSAEANKQFLIRASYIEIYNEEVRDLLSANPTNRLELKEHPEKGVYVQGMIKQTVTTISEITKLMEHGAANRSVGATLMNADSSRSHSIFIVEIETSEPVPDGVPGDVTIKQGVLNLVDLAGSERQSKTGAQGQRLKEATKINLSLSALGNVISALVAGKPHIPYRDSKLTRLLQNSLGGNAKTVMIAAISPAHYNYEETLSTLRYANRAKNIKNKPKVNEDPRDALLREYQDEIKRLKELLQQSGSGGGVSGGLGLVKGSPEWEAALEAEKKRMIAEAQEDMARLQREKEASVREAQRLKEMLAAEREAQADRIRALEEAASAVDEETRRRKLAAARRMNKGAGKKKSASSDGEEAASSDGDSQTCDEPAVSDDGLDDDFEYSPEDDERLEADREAIHAALEEERAKQQQLEERWERAAEDVRAMEQQRDADGELRDKRIQELQERLERLQSEATAKQELEKRLEEMQQQLIEGGRRQQDVNDQMLKAQETIQKLVEQQRAAKALRAKQLAEHQRREQRAETEIQEKNNMIRELQRRNAQLQQETLDLQSEFDAERRDYLRSIQELTREVQLFKQIAQTVFKPGDMELILRTARYDETRSVWNLSHITLPVVLPVISPFSGPHGGDPANNQEATLLRLQAAQQRNIVPAQTYKNGGLNMFGSRPPRPISGPGLNITVQPGLTKPKNIVAEIISSAGPHSPGIGSPSPYVPIPPDSSQGSRAGSSRGGVRPTSVGHSSTPPPTAPPKTTEELQNELENLKPRPGFVPPPSARGPRAPSPVTSQQEVFEATERLETAVGYRPGFVPASMPGASSSFGAASPSSTAPLSARGQPQQPAADLTALDELTKIQRRPGFVRPNLDTTNSSLGSTSSSIGSATSSANSLLDTLSQGMPRRPGFQPAR